MLFIIALIVTSKILWSPKWPCDHDVHKVLNDCDACGVLASLNNCDLCSVHDDHGIHTSWLIVVSLQAKISANKQRNYSNCIHP